MPTVTKAGRYEIVSELGRGAMGVVYKAGDPVIGRTVAVKTIKLNEAGTGLSRPELLARFQTEARAAGCSLSPISLWFSTPAKKTGFTTSLWNWWERRAWRRLWIPGRRY